MKSENIRSIYVRPLEGREIPSKQDIIKGISSKDLREKEKSFNFLIINIINDTYYEQNIMLIINHILPSQSKSVLLKKLVLIYWEIIQKKKHNGVVLDEFILVCNNLRNDLNHSNEFIVGATLKLISRIAISEIIDSLIVPIYENGLKHIEAFVRRNAVECLFELYTKFGEEVIHDLDEKMIEILSKESDINTKRNAIMLLFKVNHISAVDYVYSAIKADGIESFVDIIQLVIVKNLFDLCKKDLTHKQKYLKLILEFITSPFNSVLFEIGNSIADYSSNSNVISSSVSQMVKILQDIPDVSIKLIILQKLFFFKGLSAKYVNNAVPECLKLLETENTEVRIKIIKLIQSYINQANIDEFMTKLKTLFYSMNDPNVNEKLNEKLRSNLLKTMIAIMRQKMIGKIDFKEDIFKDIFNFLIENDLKNNENISLLKSFLEISFTSRSKFRTDLLKMSINNFLSIQNSEVLSTLLTLVSQEIETPMQAEELLEQFFDLNISLKDLLKKRSTQASEIPSEIKKIQTVKTIIKEDGSYGTEIVEEISGPAHTNLESSKYKFLINMLSNNTVFLINFFRNIVNLLKQLKQDSKNTKRLIASFCHSAFLLYSFKQKEQNKEEFVFTELNQLIKEMISGTPAVQRQQSHKFSINSQTTIVEGKNQEKTAIQFDQMLSFRVIK